jgi:hypothetical protein
VEKLLSEILNIHAVELPIKELKLSSGINLIPAELLQTVGRNCTLEIL